MIFGILYTFCLFCIPGVLAFWGAKAIVSHATKK